MVTTLERFVEEELAAYRRARAAGRREEAWAALERAHILSQPGPWLHTRVHLEMLRFGLALGDWREVRGQVARVAVAALGSGLGRAPAGNTGRATVPIMAVMPVPPEVEAKLAAARAEIR
ncbi:MAG TPA: DUF3703 domain-containing protein [Azospirillaceae bacterium]|nr:DUF3703 domain-containing protein [Azospirillaceae bacterium]